MNAHSHTPTLTAMDPRSLAILSVAYCRRPDNAVIESRITRQIFDAQGRMAETWDPRLWGTASKPNLSTLHGLSGQPLLTDSVDAGWQLSLLDQAGSLCSFRDARGSQRHIDYDDQYRPIKVAEQAAGEPSRVLERLAYGGSDPAFTLHNQCGRLIRHDNPASTQFVVDYGLTGSVLIENCCFLIDLGIPDWPLQLEDRDSLLEKQSFVTCYAINPAGELQRLTDAMGNERTFGYDVAGKLREAWLLLDGPGNPQRLVSDIRYNAHDQIDSETAGNGVVTRAEYSADDGRLIRLSAQIGDEQPLQDLSYRYDPIGNIVESEDKCQPVSFFNNQRIDPINRYRYDNLYQLIEASGWEVSQPSHGPALPDLLPTPLDPTQRRNYTQRFEYDSAGNLITRHHSGAPGFSMFTSARSNRSLAQREDGSLPGEAQIDSGFDACGNQRELQRGQTMMWDSRNQLSRVVLVKRANEPDDYECYTYDRPGHRLRKVHVSQANSHTLRTEVRYLPGLEVHRQFDGEERHVISVDAGRCSVRALHWPDGAHTDQLRYSLSDHLGSTTLELDHEAGVLTREHYYAFGGTACWAGKSALVAKYKTLRYSGKERDATGLYYYGYRYYAPWLQRWINPDPAGDTDGPNQYVMVSNNPVNFVDRSGLRGELSSLRMLQSTLVAIAGSVFGWIAGHALTGTALGALLGTGWIAVEYGINYRRTRDEETAAAERDRSNEEAREQVSKSAARRGLTDKETEDFTKFALDARDALDGKAEGFAIRASKDGGIYGFVGPDKKLTAADKIIKSEIHPVQALRQLGLHVSEIRSPPKAHSSPILGGAVVGQFESESPVAVSSQGRQGSRSQEVPGTVAVQSPSAASARQMEIDTGTLSTILAGASPSDEKIVHTTVEKLINGRQAAVSFKRYSNGFFYADLPGYGGGQRRGTHRLQLSFQGGQHYKVEGIKHTHR